MLSKMLITHINKTLVRVRHAKYELLETLYPIVMFRNADLNVRFNKKDPLFIMDTAIIFTYRIFVFIRNSQVE